MGARDVEDQPSSEEEYVQGPLEGDVPDGAGDDEEEDAPPVVEEAGVPVDDATATDDACPLPLGWDPPESADDDAAPPEDTPATDDACPLPLGWDPPESADDDAAPPEDTPALALLLFPLAAPLTEDVATLLLDGASAEELARLEDAVPMDAPLLESGVTLPLDPPEEPSVPLRGQPSKPMQNSTTPQPRPRLPHAMFISRCVGCRAVNRAVNRAHQPFPRAPWP
jgi:hypothetical protein